MNTLIRSLLIASAAALLASCTSVPKINPTNGPLYCDVYRSWWMKPEAAAIEDEDNLEKHIGNQMTYRDNCNVNPNFGGPR